MLPQNDGHADDTDPTDGAGPTRWGFTYGTWTDAMRYSGGSPITMANFMMMTEDGAGTLAESYFWNRLGGKIMPSGTDVSVIDWCFNSGVSGALLEIQAKLKVKVDGIWGPQTLAAINTEAPDVFVQNCYEWRVAYFHLISAQPGDFTRAAGVLSLATSLLSVP